MELDLRRPPGRRLAAIEGGGHLPAEDGETLAHGDQGRELGNRGLPPADLGDVGRRQQPSGQARAAGTGPRRAKQLEERALAEEVEVVREHVRLGTVVSSVASGSRPRIREPAQPLLVELRASLGLPLASPCTLVEHHEHDERDSEQGHEEPGQRAHRGQGACGYGREEHEEARHREPPSKDLGRRGARQGAIAARRVFDKRGGRLRGCGCVVQDRGSSITGITLSARPR